MDENRTSVEDSAEGTVEAVTATVNEESEEYFEEPLSDETEDDIAPRVSERDEYDRLIKTRFKALYAADTQKMINRRFRKYKVLEERYRIMEEVLAQKEARIAETEQKIAEFDAMLRDELARAVKETEERILNQVKARQLRPAENAVADRRARAGFDVTQLTKTERARLAKRAADGERIKF
ncbi:MAG: hypothetical protein IJY39_09765 [Clostridia bacterium]|nr:hypothetical protein [Clostridia bacterium]